MQKKFQKFLRVAYGRQLPIRQRFFNITFTCGFLVGIAGILACIMLHSSKEAILVSTIMTFAFPVLAALGIAAKKAQTFIVYFSLCIVNFIIFPALYITGGNIYCGIPAYFAFGIALTFFLTKGLPGIILAVLESGWYIFVYYLSWYKGDEINKMVPAFLEPNGYRNFQFQAVSSNAFMVCLAAGILAKIVFQMYLQESKLVNESIKEVESQSIIDPLTAIYNRRHMYSCLTNLVASAHGDRTPLSIVMFDIDHFKTLNDTYGHPLGDSVLKSIAAIIKKSCRKEELVARYGGEEFILILPGITEAEAFDRAEDIRICIEKSYLSPELPENEPVTISGGVATLRASLDEEKLVALADKALYKAKETGRNRIVKGSEAK